MYRGGGVRVAGDNVRRVGKIKEVGGRGARPYSKQRRERWRVWQGVGRDGKWQEDGGRGVGGGLWPAVTRSRAATEDKVRTKRRGTVSLADWFEQKMLSLWRTAVGRRRLTDDCVPSGDDAVKDAIEHDAVREQGGHDLAHHPAERSSCSREGSLCRYRWEKDWRGQTTLLMLSVNSSVRPSELEKKSIHNKCKSVFGKKRAVFHPIFLCYFIK